MKSFFSLFKRSACELKSIRCITVTGILVAMFVVLDMYSIRIGEFIKINLAFFPLASVGILFGPVPAMLAALAGDFVGCFVSGQSPLPLLSLTAMTEGLIYGALLYGKSGKKLALFSVIARLADSLIVSIALNTPILMYYGFMTKTAQQFYVRLGKTAAELVFFIPVILAGLPAVLTIYNIAIGKHYPAPPKNE